MRTALQPLFGVTNLPEPAPAASERACVEVLDEFPLFMLALERAAVAPEPTPAPTQKPEQKLEMKAAREFQPSGPRR